MTAFAVRVGDAMPERSTGPVTLTDIVRFAGAGGDFNPLHHDQAVASAAGFDGVISMGQYQAGLLAAAVSDWAGVENVTSFAVRFRRPVRVGDTLNMRGNVVAVDDDEARIDLSVSAGDVVVLTGTATARIRLPDDTAGSPVARA
ncbi:MaoC family dehydratase [Microbacterium aurum]